jgi:hypothetical protein
MKKSRKEATPQKKTARAKVETLKPSARRKENAAKAESNDRDYVEIAAGKAVPFHRLAWFEEISDRVPGRVTSWGGQIANLLAQAARDDSSRFEGDRAYLSLRHGAFQDLQRVYYTNEVILGLHWGSSMIEFAMSPTQARGLIDLLGPLIQEAEEVAKCAMPHIYETETIPAPGYDLEQIRRRVNIIEIVSPHVALQELDDGDRRRVGRCPLCHGGTPSLSFMVDPESGLWRCSNCHAGGDMFRFVEIIEHVDFREAAARLGRRLGMEPRSS